MSSYNKLSQLQYNLCKEASNIPSPSLHLSGILLRQGFETERKDLYSLSRCFYCYFQEIDADHGEYHCQNYLCYVFVLVSCWKTMKSYDNILCYFWQGNYASATFVPHVFLLVATYHTMIKSYQNVFCWFDSTIMLLHCTFGMYFMEIASYHLNELCKCQKDLADNQ